MAELQALPAPVVPVVVAEEPAAGVVPADAELQPPSVVEAEVFSVDCFWFFGRRVSVPQCLLHIRLVSSLGFPCRCAFILSSFAFPFLKPNFVFLVIFIVLYTFVLLCILPVLRKFFLHRTVYLLCLVRIFLSRVFVALRFLCEVRDFFSVFCTFCLRVCKFPVFFKFGDTAL